MNMTTREAAGRPPRKILVITYYWPPAGGPGVQRWLKFANYLPDLTLDPVILTVDPDKAEYPVRDATLLEEVRPGLQVHHTGTSSGWYGLYKRLTRAKAAPYSGFVEDGTPSPQQKISRFIRGNFFLPDARRGWNKHAYRAACRLLRDQAIDTVITTGPPMSVHLVGRRLQRLQHVRWIADFRDPWTDIFYYDKLYPTPLARTIDRHYERDVLERADAVIVVSTITRDLFLAKSPAIAPAKVHVIHNGHDPRDFAGGSPRKQAFTIAYTGTLPADCSLAAFIAATRQLSLEAPLRLTLVGKVDPRPARQLEELEAPSVCIDYLPFLPHADAIQHMRRSSVLLLVIPDAPGTRGHVPGKLFEYIASGTPVLSLGPVDGEAASILRDCGAGATFHPDDWQGILHFLRACRNGTPPLHRNPMRIAAYSRTSLTRLLADIIAKP